MKFFTLLLKAYVLISSFIMILFFTELMIFRIFNVSKFRYIGFYKPKISIEEVMVFNIFNYFPLLIISAIFLFNDKLRKIGFLGGIALALGLYAIGTSWKIYEV